MWQFFAQGSRALHSVLLAMMLLLVACSGGGTSVAEITGSGSRQGDIEAFGSVFIAGERHNTHSADVVINGTRATEAQLQVGMKAELSLRPNRDRVVDRISVNSRLVGQIDEVDLAQRRIFLLGQEVRIDDRTVLHFDEPNALKVDQVVSVFGSEVSGGVLLAGRIEGITANATTAVNEQVFGLVSNISGAELSIGNLAVDISSLASSPAVKTGDRVMVSGLRRRSTNAGRLEADELRIVPLQTLAPDERVLLVGVISQFGEQSGTSPADFLMDGTAVHHIQGTDTIVGGSRAGAQNGSRIAVEGFAVDKGLVRGRVITFIPDVEAEVETQVTAVDVEAGTLTVFGDVTVELGVQSQFIAAADSELRAYSLGDIAVGDRIELRLSRVDLFGSRNQLLSDAELEIARVTAQGNAIANELIVAPLESVDEAKRQIILLGQIVNITDATQFGSHDDEAGFFAGVEVGDVLEVELSNSGGQLAALEVSIDNGELNHNSALEFPSDEDQSEVK